MPPRTTLIQRVLFQVQRQLAADAVVEESVCLSERVSNQKREVDVVLRRKVGEHEVIISIECREQKRKATVEWVEQMMMKHAALPTNKLVLVSRSGFTEAALIKARNGGVETFTLTDVAAANWNELIGIDSPEELTFWMWRVVMCWLVLVKEGDTVYRASPWTKVCHADGTSRGVLNGIVYEIVDGSTGFANRVGDLARQANGPQFTIQVRHQPPLFIRVGDDALVEVAHLRLDMEAHEAPQVVEFKTAQYRENRVAYAAGETPAGHVTLSLVHSPGRNVTGVISVENLATGGVTTTPLIFPESGEKLPFVSGPLNLPAKPKEE